MNNIIVGFNEAPARTGSADTRKMLICASPRARLRALRPGGRRRYGRTGPLRRRRVLRYCIRSARALPGTPALADRLRDARCIGSLRTAWARRGGSIARRAGRRLMCIEGAISPIPGGVPGEGRRHVVAALFVHSRVPYASLPNVDAWPEARDARRYRGPWPVVAHPPCVRWTAYTFFARGGVRQHRTIGDDGGCFAVALRAVQIFGGVIEHPRHARAWRAFGLFDVPS